jgi:fermentation-respiration switch protein FrsA (DUF1100 family)
VVFPADRARHVMGTLLGVAAIVALGVVLIWTLQRKLMYFPLTDVPAPAAIGLGATPVRFPTRDGLGLEGWFIAPPGDQPAWFTAIVFNGNAGNRAFRAPLGDALARRGIAVLLFDYRGYGGNPGAPTEQGLALDSRAARDYVLSRRDVDPLRLAYFGESLGSGVAVDLAAEHPPAALILRSPFPSMAAVGAFHYPLLPVRWLLRDRYSTIDRISRIRCPLLVIAGEVDSIVPPAHSRAVFEAATQPKTLTIIERADHNDEALSWGRALIDAVVRFLEDASRGPS